MLSGGVHRRCASSELRLDFRWQGLGQQSERNTASFPFLGWGLPWWLVAHPALLDHRQSSSEQDSLGLEIILELAFLWGLSHSPLELGEA